VFCVCRGVCVWLPFCTLLSSWLTAFACGGGGIAPIRVHVCGRLKWRALITVIVIVLLRVNPANWGFVVGPYYCLGFGLIYLYSVSRRVRVRALAAHSL